MARVNWTWLGCGLLLAYGCGRVGSNDAPEASGGKGGSGLEAGTAASRAGSSPSTGGAPVMGGASGGSLTSGQGGANMARGGSPSETGGASGSGGRVSQAGAPHGGTAAAGQRAAGGEATAGAASAGEAGSGGEGPAAGACAVTLRSDGNIGALQSAVDAAEVPSTICLEAGGFRGGLKLRAGVSLRGAGWASVICGPVIGDGATTRMTTLSDLQLAGALTATGNVQLSLRNLEINTGRTAICAPASGPVTLTQNSGGEMNLVIDGVTVESPGFEIRVTPGAARIDDSIVLTNSRCNSTSQCYDFLRFTFDTAPATQSAAGSRMLLDVSNNVVRNIVLEGVVFEILGGLSAEDTANSRLWFRHNTLASAGDLNSAIAFWSPPALPIVLANNVVAYIRTPVFNLDAPNVFHTGNVFSDNEGSTSWFEDFALGDFSPKPDSPMIAGGDEDYGIPTDIEGKARSGGFDSGAYQH
jgi:hypothetical protein